MNGAACPVRWVRVCDSSLRDGSNAVGQGLTPDQVATVARALDGAGVYAIEVGHGDGLAASSIHYGESRHSDLELIRAAAAEIRHAELAVNMQPGVGTKDDIRAARDCGGTVIKVATHCTEADIAIQHIGLARELTGHAAGGLMMTHLAEPDTLARNARIMAEAGAECVYVADSAGALTMDGMRARVRAVRAALPDDVDIAVHAHNNLGLAIANTVVAVEEGARVIDACLAGFGAGAGNCQLEALVAVLHRMEIQTGVDLWKVMDAADDCVRPIMQRTPTVDRTTISLGYAGVYSSFLNHVRDAAERYSVDPRDLLVELGRRRVVAGQEDVILDAAVSLSAAAPVPMKGRP
jgi:4-hydroxy 2-oxovalerate aldolase